MLVKYAKRLIIQKFIITLLRENTTAQYNSSLSDGDAIIVIYRKTFYTPSLPLC